MSLLAIALILFVLAGVLAGACLLSMLYGSPWRSQPHLNPTRHEQTLACLVGVLIIAGLVIGTAGMV